MNMNEWTPYWITNDIAVDFRMRIKLADLDYANDGKNRCDDQGVLWVAPFVKAKDWPDCPLGLVAIYASTNGDPVLLGRIEEGEVMWYDERSDGHGLSDSMREVLSRADWMEDNGVDGYVWPVRDSLNV